jgi:hypothetical protein
LCTCARRCPDAPGGAARTLAFFGTYRIVVTKDGKTVSREILHDRKGRSTQVEVVLE